jgi:hypothetical protein
MHYTQRWLPTLLFYCTWTILVLTACYLFIRQGVPTHYFTILRNLSLALFLLQAPAGITNFFHRKYRQIQWLSISGVTCLTLIGLAVWGWIMGDWAFLVLWLIIPTAWWLSYKQVSTWLKCHFSSQTFLIIIVWTLFSIYLATRIWGIGYLTPLFDVELITAAAHPDTLFHVSIANMLRTYGVSSTGVDDLVFIPYHFGSHWLFASLANVTATRTLDFYHLAYPIIFLPLLCFSILHFSHEIYHRVAKSLYLPTHQLLFWVLFIAGFTGVLPLVIQNRSHSETIFYDSESYTLGIFLLLHLILIVWQLGRTGFSSLKIAISGLLVMLLGIIKISFLMMCLPLAVFFIWHKSYLKKIDVVLVLVSLGVIGGNIYHRLTLIDHQSSLKNLPEMIQFFVTPWNWVWLLATYSTLGVAVWLFMSQSLKLYRPKVQLLFWSICLTAVIGSFPSLLLNVPGGNNYYFSDIQKWLSLGLCLGLMPYGKLKTKHIFTTGLILGLLGLFSLNFFSSTKFLLSQTGIRKDRMLEVIGTLDIRHPKTLTPSLAIWNQLDTLSNLNLAEKKQLQLLIHRDSAYWQLVNRCEATPLIAPAVTGIVMIEGLPAAGCDRTFFGHRAYESGVPAFGSQRTTYTISTNLEADN